MLVENPVALSEPRRLKHFLLFSLVSDVSLQIILPVGTPTDPSATNHLITTSTS